MMSSGTEIGGDDLLHEDAELNVIRLIDADLTADVVDLLLAGNLAGEHIRRVAADCVEQDEHEQHDAEHRRNHLPKASNDVGVHRCHAGLPANKAAAGPSRHVRAAPPLFSETLSSLLSTYSRACCLATSSDYPVATEPKRY